MKNTKIYRSTLPAMLVILTLFVGLTGCAPMKPMALKSNTKTVDVSSKSVLLMTLDVFRTDSNRYVPNPSIISFEKPNTTDKPEIQMFQIKSSDSVEKQDGRSVYMLSMDLEPGQYKLRGISGDANAFPFHGFFFVPLHMDIQIQKNAVTYVGRVKAELRPRQGNEFRAGAVVPLIDQSATGVSTGTFDVAIEDLSQEDISLFRTTYPALGNTKIDTALLPPFDRSKVQLWWENDYKSVPAIPVEEASTPSSKVSPIGIAVKAQ